MKYATTSAVARNFQEEKKKVPVAPLTCVTPSKTFPKRANVDKEEQGCEQYEVEA
jgi:hypothetical protein